MWPRGEMKENAVLYLIHRVLSEKTSRAKLDIISVVLGFYYAMCRIDIQNTWD